MAKKKKRKLTIPEMHQLRIAKETIKFPLKGKFLGGPSLEEAKKIIKKLVGR